MAPASAILSSEKSCILWERLSGMQGVGVREAGREGAAKAPLADGYGRIDRRSREDGRGFRLRAGGRGGGGGSVGRGRILCADRHLVHVPVVTSTRGGAADIFASRNVRESGGGTVFADD